MFDILALNKTCSLENISI